VQAEERRERRGRLKIFLGYAPRVGKSLRMFDEGRRRKERGQDVVIAAAQNEVPGAVREIVSHLEIIPTVDGAIDRRDNLQVGDDLAYGAGDLILRGGDHHVLAAFLATPPLVEHAQRFANARGVTQENLETATPFTPLLRLHAAQ